MFTKYIVGVSLSEPHIDHDNVPRARNNGMYLCIYLCMYHLPCVCCTLVSPEMFRVFWYIDLLTYVIYNYMHSTEQQGRLELLISAMKIIDEDR